jgi:hypothetical protein
MMALFKEDWNKIGAKAAQYFQCCYYPTKMNRSYTSGAVAVRWEGNLTSNSASVAAGRERKWTS